MHKGRFISYRLLTHIQPLTNTFLLRPTLLTMCQWLNTDTRATNGLKHASAAAEILLRPSVCVYVLAGSLLARHSHNRQQQQLTAANCRIHLGDCRLTWNHRSSSRSKQRPNVTDSRKTTRLQPVYGGQVGSRSAVDHHHHHALSARTMKTTQTVCGCYCCVYPRLSFELPLGASPRLHGSRKPTALAVCTGRESSRPRREEKCGLFMKTRREEVWRLQNKSPSTNQSLRVTFRMWVNQSESTSHEPFYCHQHDRWYSFPAAGCGIKVKFYWLIYK